MQIQLIFQMNILEHSQLLKKNVDSILRTEHLNLKHGSRLMSLIYSTFIT